jgi:EVE domain
MLSVQQRYCGPMRNLVFFVTDKSWVEHNTVGIAAINDPGAEGGRHANSGRQKAIAELAGIRPGDRIFFKVGRSDQHPPRIVGLYRATSEPYFDTSFLFSGAEVVDDSLALRVEFECVKNYPNPIDIEHLWLSKERGGLWTIQQARGDVLGRHACASIANDEADLIIRLLEANNPVCKPPVNYSAQRAAVGLKKIKKSGLPIDYSESSRPRKPTPGRLHYEASLESILIEELCGGLHRDLFGDFTEVIPFVSTGAQTELDILLSKYDGDKLLWHQVVELKAHTFSEEELRKVIDYEKWILNIRCENVLQIHSVGIGYDFAKEVAAFVKDREKYKDRPIRLIRYQYDTTARQLKLEPVE